jgi:hypothetical protein
MGIDLRGANLTSFTKKGLKFEITLEAGKFGSSENNQIIIKDKRAFVQIVNAGGSSLGQSKVKIFGVTQNDMNSISMLRGLNAARYQNSINIYAIDNNVEVLIFKGTIINAWADYTQMPDVFLSIDSINSFVNKIIPVPPRSYKGQIDVATVIQQIAESIGLHFENNGVSVILNDVYLPNTAMEQINTIVQMANIDIYRDVDGIAICPKNVSRGGIAAIISKETGLIGYPTFDSVGVNFSMVFNPIIQFGGKIDVRSDLHQANGLWTVTSVNHDLTSEMPNGSWMTTIRGLPSGLAITKF